MSDHMREGDASSTHPEGEIDKPLVMRLFGGLEIRVRGQSPPDLNRHSCRWLLAAIALWQARHPGKDPPGSDQWGESLGVRPDSVKQIVRRARMALGDEKHRLSSQPYKLDLTDAWVDVIEFDRLVEQARRAATGSATKVLEEALRLFERGELLEGCDCAFVFASAVDRWFLDVKRHYQDQYLWVLDAAARDAKERQEWDKATAYYEKFVKYCAQIVACKLATKEKGWIGLIESLGAAGCPTTHLEQTYNQARRRLQREHKTTPSSDLQTVYEHAYAEAKKREEEARHDRPPAPAPGNIHAPVEELVGREHDIERVMALLATDPPVRLITLTGVPGSGKTTLAREIAHVAQTVSGVGVYPGGVDYIALDVLDDPGSVPEAKELIAREITQRLELGSPTDTYKTLLLDHLKWSPERLLVLDNCEHLHTASCSLIKELLSSCERVRFLTTSRSRLDTAGEYVYEVAPLGTDDAIRLFESRAAAAGSGFKMASEDLPKVSIICRALSGIPLLIRLAAGWVSKRTLAEILRWFEEDPYFARRLRQDHPDVAHHASYDTLMNWSYELLSEEQQALYRRLSVFVGGWTASAAVEVCADEMVRREEVADYLDELVRHALIQRPRELTEQEPRYEFLPVLRQYPACLLANDPQECATTRDRHLQYYLKLLRQTQIDPAGPDLAKNLELLGEEKANLRAALDWAEESKQIATALRLAGALWPLWSLRGEYREGRERLETLLARPDAQKRTEGRMHALHAAGRAAGDLGEWAVALHRFEECLSIAQERRDRFGEAQALHCCASARLAERWHGQPPCDRVQHEVSSGLELIADSLGALTPDCDRTHPDHRRLLGLKASGLMTKVELLRATNTGVATVLAVLDEAESIRRELEDWPKTASTLTAKSGYYMTCGRRAEALVCARQSIELREKSKGESNIDAALRTLAWIQYELGLCDDARSTVERLLRSSERRGLPAQLDQGMLGQIDLACGKLTEARAEFEAARAWAEQNNDPIGLAQAQRGLGCVALYQKEYDRAAELLSRAVERWRMARDTYNLWQYLVPLALAEIRRRHHKEAQEHLVEALSIAIHLDCDLATRTILEMLAQIAVVRKAPRLALELLAAASIRRPTVGAVLLPWGPEYVERCRTRAESQLPASVWEEGRKKSLLELQTAVEALGFDEPAAEE